MSLPALAAGLVALLTMSPPVFAASTAAPARGHTWTADNGDGTFTNPLFNDEFSDPASSASATTTT